MPRPGLVPSVVMLGGAAGSYLDISLLSTRSMWWSSNLDYIRLKLIPYILTRNMRSKVVDMRPSNISVNMLSQDVEKILVTKNML